MLLVVAIIALLLERQVEVWDPAFRIAAPVPAAVTLATAASPAAAAPVEAVPVPETAPPAPPPPPPAPDIAPVAPPPPAPVAPAERYALESGPFVSAEAADRIEDQLNHLGYATVRFRKQEVRRLYLVSVVGLPSTRDARRAAGEIGRGTVVEGEEGVVVQVDRLPSLGEAVVAARLVRARGFEVRVDEDLGPAVIYHVRYGQFPSQVEAEARGEELALFGLTGHVVKVK
jgi:flagellar motor switch protein FliN/FliY